MLSRMELLTIPPTLPLSIPLPQDVPDIDQGVPRPKLMQATLNTERLLLRLSVNDVLGGLNVLPVPRRYGGKGWGPPKPVTGSALSNWLNMKDVMPAYRLSAAVAILEIYGIWWEWDVETSKDKLLAERLALAWEHHEVLIKEPTLQPWLRVYRLGIAERLRKDRNKSEYDRKMYERYHASLKPVLDEYKKSR